METAQHPRNQLNELIHQPVRFSIMAALVTADEVEFSFLRDCVEVSDSLLSRYLSQLESAGYVVIRKGFVGKFPRTWVSLSPAGRAAFLSHMKTLNAIAAGTPVPGA